MRKFHDSYLLLNKVRAIDWWLSVRTTTSGQFFFVLHLWNKNLQNQTKPLYCAKDQCEKKNQNDMLYKTCYYKTKIWLLHTKGEQCTHTIVPQQTF